MNLQRPSIKLAFLAKMTIGRGLAIRLAIVLSIECLKTNTGTHLCAPDIRHKATDAILLMQIS